MGTWLTAPKEQTLLKARYAKQGTVLNRNGGTVQLSGAFWMVASPAMRCDLPSDVAARWLEQVVGSPFALSQRVASEEWFQLPLRRRQVFQHCLDTWHGWEAFLSASVVVSADVLLLATSDEEGSCVDFSALESTQRWNASLVEAAKVLWWEEEEWDQVVTQLRVVLSEALTKLTVDAVGVVSKAFFIKEHCGVSNLA